VASFMLAQTIIPHSARLISSASPMLHAHTFRPGQQSDPDSPEFPEIPVVRCKDPREVQK
jgi:hypothetical protein